MYCKTKGDESMVSMVNECEIYYESIAEFVYHLIDDLLQRKEEELEEIV
jgi:hypothetical protein